MKRRIVQHGSSSLTITLPIKWVKKFGLKKGDEIQVEEAGPMLQVSTQQAIAAARKKVSTTDYGIFTKNNLSHLYQLGYDELEISFDDPKTLDEIKARLPECVGYEIIDQKDNTIFIKSIATTLESEFDTILRKSFLITNELAKNVLQALEQKNYKKLSEIRNLEYLNNKFTDICIRILTKRGYKIPNRTMQMYEILKSIERIADEFKHICDLFSKGSKDKDNKNKPDPETLKLFKDAIDYYNAFSTMFYKFDPHLKKKIYLERPVMLQKCKSQLTKSKGQNSIFLHHIIEIIEKTYQAAGGYFALVL